MRFLVLALLVMSALSPTANSQESSPIINSIANTSFETADEAWEITFQSQKGTTTINDRTRAYAGEFSSKLAAPSNVAEDVWAFVGQPIPFSLNYSLANLADSPDSLSVRWYVQSEQNGPGSLQTEVYFSDGATRSYTLGYFYGNSDLRNSTESIQFKSIYYSLGLVPDSTISNSWSRTMRNMYADIQPFQISDQSSFRITYISFGAVGNLTHGETAWVDDVRLMFNPPAAVFTVTQPSPEKLEFLFDASASLPGQGATITRYTWDLGDGTKPTSGLPTWTHTYSSQAAYDVTVQVEDSRGRVSSTGRTILAFTIKGDQPAQDGEPASFSPLVLYVSGLVLSAVFLVALFSKRRRRF